MRGTHAAIEMTEKLTSIEKTDNEWDKMVQKNTQLGREEMGRGERDRRTDSAQDECKQRKI